VQSLRLSWSAIKSFLECQRKYQFGYIEGIMKPYGGDSGTIVTGSHVHAGWEAALKSSYNDPSLSMQGRLTDALIGVRNYRNANLDNTKVIFNWETQAYEPDGEYFAMMEDAYENACAILTYQLPRFNWDRYSVVSLEDLFSGVSEDKLAAMLRYSPKLRKTDEPLVEWKFELPYLNHTLVGVVDAVLFDHQQFEYVFLDWKTRSRWLDDALIGLDGQLPLYASLVNWVLDEPIVSRVIQYQVSSSVPGPAKLTQKGALSMAVPGSTWEVWAASVYALGMNPEQYRNEMEPKCQPPSYYTRPVDISLNADSMNRTLLNLHEVISAIGKSTEQQTFPGILSADGCQFCDFRKICTAYQGGGDPNIIIEREYIIKHGYIID